MKSLSLLIASLISISLYSQTPDENLEQLKIKLPQIGDPIGSYVDYVRVGNLIFLSGKGPRKEDKQYITGKLGKDLTLEEGNAAAALTATIQLAVLKKALGDLSKVKRIVKVNGYVNSDTSFYDQPKVINGFSDIMIKVFGEKGKHARTSIGVNALPSNMAVEIEMIVEVE